MPCLHSWSEWGCRTYDPHHHQQSTIYNNLHPGTTWCVGRSIQIPLSTSARELQMKASHQATIVTGIMHHIWHHVRWCMHWSSVLTRMMAIESRTHHLSTTFADLAAMPADLSPSCNMKKNFAQDPSQAWWSVPCTIQLPFGGSGISPSQL